MKKVCWNITSDCNKNCVYCFKFNRNNLSLGANKKILDKLIKMGVEKITWSGGEPFLYPSFIDLLYLCEKKGIYNCVNTNGSLLNTDNIEEYLKHINKIIFSLDFIDDEKNKIYGIGENYYKHLSKILELTKSVNCNISIQINTVVFSENYSHINDIFEELKKYKVDSWKIIRFAPIRGKALDNKDDISISDIQFKNIVKRYSNEKCNFNIKFDDNEDMMKSHYIVLSSGELIESVNGKDIISDNLLR